MDVVLENMVTTMDLPRPLDLARWRRYLVEDGSSPEYSPEKFSGLILRNQEPSCVIIFFPAGRIVLTGTHSIDEAQSVAAHMVELLYDADLIGDDVDVELSVRQLVGRSTIEAPVDMDILRNRLKGVEGRFEEDHEGGDVISFTLPDGERVLMMDDGTVVVWEVSRTARLRELMGSFITFARQSAV